MLKEKNMLSNLETLARLVAFATELGLPGPTGVTIQRDDDLLAVTCEGADDAIAWCNAFGIGYQLHDSGEIYYARVATWMGWTLSVSSYTPSLHRSVTTR